jgi:hypothetical protein
MSFNSCNQGPLPVRIWTRTDNNCIYGNKNELNMRRKAEILQYKHNSSKLTKKQQWANISRGNHSNKKTWAIQNQNTTNNNLLNLPRVNNTLICDNSNSIICDPTSSSDVPGKIISLCYDKNIPLINFRSRLKYTYGSYYR